MKDKNFTIALKCFFCDSVVNGDVEKEYASGDMIKCQCCGESNDYDALIEVATNEKNVVIADYAKAELEKAFKNIFKK